MLVGILCPMDRDTSVLESLRVWDWAPSRAIHCKASCAFRMLLPDVRVRHTDVFEDAN